MFSFPYRGVSHVADTFATPDGVQAYGHWAWTLLPARRGGRDRLYAAACDGGAVTSDFRPASFTVQPMIPHAILIP
jgi:hypothetical protein